MLSATKRLSSSEMGKIDFGQVDPPGLPRHVTYVAVKPSSRLSYRKGEMISTLERLFIVAIRIITKGPRRADEVGSQVL